jgi:regulator of sirC expression with transglutaminase-like and TPR domain
MRRMSRSPSPPDDPRELLRRCGRIDDAEIDVAATALALAAMARPGTPAAPYVEHLRALATDVAAAAGAKVPDVGEQSRILNSVLIETHGYAGDRDTYDDLRNANLMSVIDRRRGLPIALSILYVHAARAQGWRIGGVDFPGHFLLRLGDGAGIIIDPFNGGRARSAADLRALIKTTEGADAELRREHCRPAGNRQMLLRLQNNIKLRLLRDDKLAEAVDVIEHMLLIAPDNPGLWHEAGALHGRIGNLRAAVAALEKLAALSRGSPDHGRAAQLLTEMKSRLN